MGRAQWQGMEPKARKNGWEGLLGEVMGLWKGEGRVGGRISGVALPGISH